MIKNLYAARLDAEPDPSIGISLAHLTGDKRFSLYGTEILSERRLTAHFHRQGDELYQVVEGRESYWTILNLKAVKVFHTFDREQRSGLVIR